VIILIVVVVAVAAAGAGLFIAYHSLLSPTKQVTIEDVCADSIDDVNFTYIGTGSGFASSVYGPTPTYCETVTLPPNSTIALSILVHSNDLQTPHQVNKVLILPPYALAGIAPTPPCHLAAGGNVSFTLDVQLPSIGGLYNSPTANVTLA
jgi:hypothetical protein